MAKKSLRFTADSIVLGGLVAPLMLTQIHWLHADWFSQAWPPWVYLWAVPYGLCAVAALPYLIARGVIGRWPRWPWLPASFTLTGGLIVMLAALALGVPLASALQDGVLYGGLCLLTVGFFLAIAVVRRQPPWIRRYIEGFDHIPPLPLGAEHPVRKGWYELDAVDHDGRLLWYQPPSPRTVRLRRAIIVAVSLIGVPLFSLLTFYGYMGRGGEKKEARRILGALIQYRPSRYVLLLIAAAMPTLGGI